MRFRWQTGCEQSAHVAPANEPLGARVRKAKVEKLPYALVVGDEDVESGMVGVNARGSEEPERGVAIDDFVDRLRAEVLARGGCRRRERRRDRR